MRTDLPGNGSIHFRKRRRSSIRMLFGLDVNTERMTVGIQMHADVFLGLVLGHGGAARLGMGATGGEIVDQYLEVHLHDLLAWFRRPGGPGPDIFDMEREPYPAVRIGKRYPAGILFIDLPTEEAGIEAS